MVKSLSEGGLSYKNILELAKLSKAIYSGPLRHDFHTFDGVNFSGQIFVYGTLWRGYCRIVWSKNVTVVAFRGTKWSAVDWIYSNMRFLPTNIEIKNTKNYIHVHSGFHSTLLYNDRRLGVSGFEAIMFYLMDQKLLDRELHVTGHSLGGALATLFAAMYRSKCSNGESAPFVTTFGAPAVGGRRFHEFYGSLHERTLRVVNGPDPVPFTPPFKYRHVGKQLWLNPGGNSAPQIDDIGWARRLGVALRVSPTNIIKSHSINGYIMGIQHIIDCGVVI